MKKKYQSIGISIKEKLTSISLQELSLYLIFVIGLVFRLWLVISKVMWLDEISYYSLAKNNSIFELLKVDHWIKDVPPFYLIFVKLWSFVSKSKLWLKLPGIISYALGFHILSSFFNKSRFAVKALVLWTYSLSIYFSFLQSWISPYNLTIMWSLVMYVLLTQFAEGFFDRKIGLYYFLVVFVNWLLINTHYSSVFFLLGYLSFYIYIRKNCKKRLNNFIFSMVIAFIFSIPTLIRLERFYDIYPTLYKSEMFFDISKPFGLFSNLIFKSIFRSVGKSLVLFAFFLAGLLRLIIIKDNVFNKLHAVFSFVFLIGGYTFLYLISPLFKSFVVERALLIFHLGLLFLYGTIFDSKKSKGNILFNLTIVVFMLFPTYSLGQYIMGKSVAYLPGDVASMIYPQRSYDKFLLEIKSNTKDDSELSIYLHGFLHEVDYADVIFNDYYLKNSSITKDLDVQIVDRFELESNEYSNLLILNFCNDGCLVDDLDEYRIKNKQKYEIIHYKDYVSD